jgi:hypothetical protein
MIMCNHSAGNYQKMNKCRYCGIQLKGDDVRRLTREQSTQCCTPCRIEIIEAEEKGDTAIQRWISKRQGKQEFPIVEIKIQSRDYWFKTTDEFKSLWVLIDEGDNGGCKTFTITDASEVIEELDFRHMSRGAIEDMIIKQHSFSKYAENNESQKFIRPPKPPFKMHKHEKAQPQQ